MTAESAPGGPPRRRAQAWHASLAGRLVLATVSFGIVFTLLSVAVRTVSAWTLQHSAMSAELAQVDQVFQRTLAKAIWDLDRDALNTHLASAIKVASVGRASLEIRQPNRPPERLELVHPDWQPSTLAPRLQRELTYEPYAGASEVVGQFSLEGDEQVLWARLRAEVLGIVVTQVVQTLLLASLVMWVFNRTVTVHVKHTARHLQELTPANLSRPLELARKPVHDDELSLLAGGVNQLQGSLSDYLARQHADELELAAHRDRLADLVRERTQALEAANAQLQTLSRSDALTGLPNRRHFDEVKEAEFRRALRVGQPLSLLLCDVDFFKRFNDRYGHAGGDECLQRVGQTLRACFGRAGDLAARVGGEEFAVVMPGSDAAAAFGAAERLRQAVAAQDIPHADSDAAPHVTLSIGVAQFDAAEMDSFDALFDRADQALYLAKRRGRNQVAAISPEASS